MIRLLLAALLNAEAPPVAPADLSDDPRPSELGRDRTLGWLAVAILGLFIVVGAIAIIGG